MAEGLPVPMNWSILNGCWCSVDECVTRYRTLSEHSGDRVWRRGREWSRREGIMKFR